MKKKIVIRTGTAFLTCLMLAGSLMPVMKAEAAAAYDSEYTQKSNWEDLILPALKKATDTNGVYRQLKLSCQYGTLSEGNIKHLYEMTDVNVSLDVIRRLYEDGLVSGYLYKTLANLSYCASDFSVVFDATEYYNNNPDLQAAVGSDAEALFQHFLNNGMQEGRSGNSEFNLSVYKENYPDLVKVYGNDNPSYYTHYMLYGKAEGRIADKLKD